MKSFFNKLIQSSQNRNTSSLGTQEDQLKRQVTALYSLYTGVLGAEKVVLKAGKLGALELMRSPELPQRVLALQKLVFEDPTIEKLPSAHEIPVIMGEIEEELADLCARRTLEDRIEKKIAEKMEERHQEYVQEIRMQVIK
ncbi:MAG: Lon family ATP-dependent protease, partial [Sporomusa sp.]